MEDLVSVDYEGGGSTDSLFALWERGHSAPLLAPLSVRRQRYRKIITMLVRRYAPRLKSRILSLGAGNGFTEASLVTAGFDVVASDKSITALWFCARKGLPTALYDLSSYPPRGLRGFDVLYCDGVLGHLWQRESGYASTWRHLAACGASDAMLIISNDLADSNEGPEFRVTSDPNASFYRPPAGWFSVDASATGLWIQRTTRVLRYKRSCARRREVLVLERNHKSLMDEGKVQCHPPHVERCHS